MTGKKTITVLMPEGHTMTEEDRKILEVSRELVEVADWALEELDKETDDQEFKNKQFINIVESFFAVGIHLLYRKGDSTERKQQEEMIHEMVKSHIGNMKEMYPDNDFSRN